MERERRSKIDKKFVAVTAALVVGIPGLAINKKVEFERADQQYGQDVVSFARKIGKRLEKGQNGRFSRYWMDDNHDGESDIQHDGYSPPLRSGFFDEKNGEAAITDKLWCTDFTYRVQRLAGLRDKEFVYDEEWSPAKGTYNLKAVVGLHAFWMKKSQQAGSGFIYTEYGQAPSWQEALEKVRAGDIVVMEEKRLKTTDEEHVGIVTDIVLHKDGSGYIKTAEGNSTAVFKKYPIEKGGKITGTPHKVEAFLGYSPSGYTSR